MIFYFSGTGNSEGIAQLLAKRLGDRAVDIVGKTPASYVFSPEDRVKRLLSRAPIPRPQSQLL